MARNTGRNEMSMSLEEALKEALDDEYRARATYRAVLEAYGDVRPFVNIVDSEERHIGALGRLFARYGIEMPADPWPSRVSAPESLEAACAAGVEAELENRALYERLMAAAVGHPDVEETFRNLQSASQDNHLPAFERALEREREGGGSGRSDGPGRRRRRRHRGGGGDGRD
jgi:hypothetical protein